jgi:hypothetical protein
MTPSLPTFSKASAMILPTSWSLLALMEATFWMSTCPWTGVDIFWMSSATSSTAVFMPRMRALASAPAVMCFRPLAEEGLGQDGGGGGAVAGVVAGLAGRLLDQQGAHVLRLCS